MSKVALFDNGSYVDTSNDVYAEADNINLSLAGKGHTVSTFTGLTASQINSALAGQQVLVIPELERGSLIAALDTPARDAIKTFVSQGGTLVLSADYGSNDTQLLNTLFGFNLQNATDYHAQFGITATADNTAYDVGNNLFNADGTYAFSGLPAGSKPLYTNGTNVAAALMPFGTGTVAFLAYDWFNSAANSASKEWNNLLDVIVKNAAPTNAAPVLVNHALTPAFGTGDLVVKIGADDLKATDADRGQTLTYTVDTLPKGVLLLHGEVAAVGATFTQADVDAGHVQLVAGPLATDVATPDGAISGAGVTLSDAFGVTVRDGAGGSVSGTFTAGHAAFDTVQTSAQWGGYWGGNGNDYQLGTSGSDNMSGGNGNDLMIGGEGNDNMSGNEGNNRLFGQGGDDNINGGNGNDLLDGGAGNDQIHANGGDNWLFGGAGNDTITADWGNDRVWGGEGDDLISVNGGDNRVDGGTGNDQINVGGGNDTVIGGTGNDVISDNGGSNKFQLGGIKGALSDGNDTYTTGQGADKFVLFLNDRDGGAAGWGNDTVNGFRIAQGDQLVAFSSQAGYWDDVANLKAVTASDFVTASRGVDGNAGDLTLTFGGGSSVASSVTLKWFFWDNGSYGTTIGSSAVSDDQLVQILTNTIQDGGTVGVSGSDFIAKMHDYVSHDFEAAFAA